MRDVAELVAGYRAFLSVRYPREAELYRRLADRGQTPNVMIVACCDSRADPSVIFSARPGEMFIVRNVANLVPPFEPYGDYHGTSAALEFAVTGLKVEHIVVMGHARCGGVQAFLDRHTAPAAGEGFIGKWMTLLRAAHGEVVKSQAGWAPEQRCRALEQASIRHSLDNLETFPFVRERLDRGDLRLHGAYFDIANGDLLSLDRASGAFEPIARDEPKP